MRVKIVNKSKHPMPKYATEGSSCVDLYANLTPEILDNLKAYGDVTRCKNPFDDEKSWIVINPGSRVLIPTGIHIQLPEGYEAQVRPRSGLALKYGITVLNTPGTIDSDYTGEIGVILMNSGTEPFSVGDGDRIAQMALVRYDKIEFEEVETLDETERGNGGFGHTGIQQHILC